MKYINRPSTINRVNYNNSLPVQLAETVRDYSPLSRADIARHLGISPSTVSRIIDRLIDRKIISEEGQNIIQQAGRPSTTLKFNSKIASVLVVDLRLPEAYVAITDLEGSILSSEIQPLPLGDAQASLQTFLDVLHRHLEVNTERPPLRGIVIGVPSLVNPNDGIVEWAPSLCWKNVPLGQIVQSSFNLPVRVENDVNLAALGEYWKGAAQNSRNMVFVSVGTGIGAGIVQNGELYYGASFAAGEVGYFLADLETLRHEAGEIGHLEMRLGRDGTLSRANLIAQRYPSSKLAELINTKKARVRASEIFELCALGDPAASVVFNETVDLLTIVFTNISVLLDPEIMILGGPSDWKWEMLVAAIKDRIGTSLLRSINIAPSVIGRDAVIKGATYTAIRLAGVLPE